MLELSHRRLAGSHAYPVGDAAAADSLAIVNPSANHSYLVERQVSARRSTNCSWRPA